MVPALGGGVEPRAAQGFGAAGLSFGDPGVSDFLQTVAAAGDGGVGPTVHGPDRGAAAAGGVATGGLEGGVELVFQDGQVLAGKTRCGVWQPARDGVCPEQGAAAGGGGFGRAGVGAEVDPGIAHAALPVADRTGVSDVGPAFCRMAGAAGKECAGG